MKKNATNSECTKNTNPGHNREIFKNLFLWSQEFVFIRVYRVHLRPIKSLLLENRSRSSRFTLFLELGLGEATKATKWAFVTGQMGLQKSITSASVRLCPPLATTTALIVSPHFRQEPR
jgi:hypothetical protein